MRLRLAFLLLILAAALATGLLLGRGGGRGGRRALVVDLDRGGHQIDTRALLGGAIDGHEGGDNAKMFTASNIAAMASSGLGPLSYRLRTELGIEAWHWTDRGTWSDARHRQGYWVGGLPKQLPFVSYGYRLPRRGNTLDQASNGGHSMIDDGDLSTFWKSNPYLDQHYTGEADALHPNWILIDLGRPERVDRLRLLYGPDYARSVAVQYWPHGSPLFQNETPVRVTTDWRSLPSRVVDDPRGAIVSLQAPTVRYLRILLADTGYHGPPTADIRDRLGVSVRELYIERRRGRRFGDLITHRPSNTQTVIYTSSTDPWHRASDQDRMYYEQPSIDFLFASRLEHGPMLVPAPVYYDNPDNAMAWLRYLQQRRYPLSGVELGEEPDGQLIAPEDYTALYLQLARRVRRLDPRWPIGGPSFQKYYPDWVFWLDRQGRSSWVQRLLAYLDRRGRRDLFNFFAFEWYPFDDPCSDATQNLRDEPGMMRTLISNLKRDGLPTGIPWIISEYGYSAYSAAAEVNLAGGILDAEIVAQFATLVQQPRTYFYGYEPAPLMSELVDTKRCDDFGNLTMLVSDDNNRAKYRVPAYYAMKMLTTDWGASQPAQIYPVSSDNPDVRAYALLRGDRRLSFLLINSSPSRPYRYALQSVRAGARRALPGPLTISQYSPANYRFQSDRERGHPTRNLPITRFTQRSAEVTLPPSSLSVASTTAARGRALRG